VTVSAEFNPAKLLRRLRANRAQGPKLIAHALNRAADSGRTAGTRAIAGDMKLKAGTVRDRIRVQGATAARHVVSFFASPKRIPVIEFGARGPMPSRGRGRGVTANTPAGRYPHAFIARMASGHVGVFQRVGKSRTPIRELRAASIAHVFRKHRGVIVDRAREQLTKNLRSNLRFMLAA
jgi:hypothetical protein